MYEIQIILFDLKFIKKNEKPKPMRLHSTDGTLLQSRKAQKLQQIEIQQILKCLKHVNEKKMLDFS